MEDALSKISTELQAELRRAGALVVGLSEAQFHWRPEQVRWSIAECLEHLTRLADEYLLRIERGCSQGPKPDKLPRFVSIVISHLISQTILSMEPPVVKKRRSPAPFQPLDREWDMQPKQEVIQKFVKAHQKIIGSIAWAREVDVNAVRIASPLAQWIKISLAQGYLFLIIHFRRHLWQIEQNMLHPDFPSC